jgi:hypothetical protein
MTRFTPEMQTAGNDLKEILRQRFLESVLYRMCSLSIDKMCSLSIDKMCSVYR